MQLKWLVLFGNKMLQHHIYNNYIGWLYNTILGYQWSSDIFVYVEVL